jgi:carbon-monoxide dehydrogenase large subunit
VYTAADLNHLTHEMWSSVYGKGAAGPPMRALADDLVRYVGDPIAIVVAENRYIAEDACDLVEIEYDPLTPVIGYEVALRDDELVHPELGTNVASHIPTADTTMDDLLASAPHVFTESFEQHRHVALPMETRGVIAKWESYADELTIWSSTQSPHEIRAYNARMLDMPEHRIRVIMGDVGGGFGQKGGFDREDMCVVLAARTLGGTVKWIEDRVENLTSAAHARAEKITVTMAVDDDGVLLGADVEHIEDVGAYPHGSTGSLGGLVSLIFPGPYRLPKFRFRNTALYTNTSGRGPYRGPWMIETFAREAMLDVVARRMGIDPLEIRRRNVIHQSELPFQSVSYMQYDKISPEETLDQAADILGYDEFRTWQTQARAEGRLVGVGFGLYVEPSMAAGALATEVATIRVDQSGKVTVIMGAASHGQSLETTMAQVVADYLGVPVDDVRYLQGDTAIAPWGGGTGASRSAVLGGGAARMGALELRGKVLAIAAHTMEAAPEDLELDDGVISVKGTPARSMTLGDVAMLAYIGHNDLPPGMQPGLEVTARFKPDGFPMTWSNAAHVCVAEVDPSSGRISIDRYIVSEDCGTMINPMVVEGQIAGGVVQGIGGVLYEHFIYDDEGNPLTTTLLDYLPPSTTEVPMIEYGHIETASNRPGGFKGMGEGGAIGSPPAIVNAVVDALSPLGVTVINTQPLTPSRVLDLIAEAGQ